MNAYFINAADCKKFSSPHKLTGELDSVICIIASQSERSAFPPNKYTFISCGSLLINDAHLLGGYCLVNHTDAGEMVINFGRSRYNLYNIFFISR